MLCHSSNILRSSQCLLPGPMRGKSRVPSRPVLVWGTKRRVSLTAWCLKDSLGTDEQIRTRSPVFGFLYCYEEQWEHWLKAHMEMESSKVIGSQMWRTFGQWDHKRLKSPKESKMNLTCHAVIYGDWGFGGCHQNRDKNTHMSKDSYKVRQCQQEWVEELGKQ